MTGVSERSQQSSNLKDEGYIQKENKSVSNTKVRSKNSGINLIKNRCDDM
ncbi:MULTISPECIES: hypothetical protein [Photorhabdus]|nr:hypothetical protein [Photorhabdus asymbiotica]